MPEVFGTLGSLDTVAQSGPAVLVRLVTALLLGAMVAQIYRRGRSEPASTFTATLVLLSVLIAMVTQIIGDNVARAFSLVGALSIVRFRTVVRDTQDTAYVIFAVIVGMAVGAQSLWVAVVGIGVIILAELAVTLLSGWSGASSREYLLTMRTELECDLDGVVRRLLQGSVRRLELRSLGTGRQGSCLEGVYGIRLRDEASLPALVKQFDAAAGVQSVHIELHDTVGN